jgi:hypothetical protein
MKLLKSKFHESFWEVNGNKYPVKVLPIADLWASVPQVETLRNKPFHENLRNDIEKDGLHFPLLTIHVTYNEMWLQKKKWKGKICELPFTLTEENKEDKMYVVWGGSQRVRVAQELGYTHIDCAMIPQIHIAHRLQKFMRAPFKKRYY